MKYTVITTFNSDGYNLYGKRMIDTWLATWPQEVELWVYAEGCQVQQSAPNLRVFDLEQASPDLVAFKTRWRDVPKANGDVTDDPIRSRRKDSGKGFKWNAIRFSHKVYSVFHAAQHSDTDWLIWMDADMVCHSAMSLSDLDRLFPPQQELCFLGRHGKYSECGLYGLQIKTKGARRFLKRFQQMYDDAENGIFTLGEWHDSFVFDAVRQQVPVQELNWSQALVDLRASKKTSVGEGHPLINSEWGRWLDHLKGDRKGLGHSKASDVRVTRTESYWQRVV